MEACLECEIPHRRARTYWLDLLLKGRKAHDHDPVSRNRIPEHHGGRRCSCLDLR